MLAHSLLFVVFLNTCTAIYNVTSDDQRCFNYDLQCNLCVQEPGCQWCSSMKNEKKTDHHCYSSSSNLNGICEGIENPFNSPVIYIKNEKLTDSAEMKFNFKYENIFQLKPQHIRLKLRRGVAKNFSVSFRQVKDYPLDLYYLMDLSKSMAEDKNTLGALGRDLARTMRVLTSQFKIGFGSFVDKVELPFVNIHQDALSQPCPDIICDPPFSFKNNLKLTENDEDFVKQVNTARISSNLDSPEGGFDALMQAMVCDDQIGWRKNVRKIIIFSTDAIFHQAGDGKLAGVVVPNDAKCHLNNEGYYERYNDFDYPSIGQINEVAQSKGVNIIFAVKEHFDMYSKLSQRIKDSAYGELDTRSNNVIKLVTDVYNNITDKIELTVKSNDADNPLSFRIFSDCGVPGGELIETNVCSNVREGTSFEFVVEIELTACLNKGKTKSQVVLGTLQDSLVIDVDHLCTCDCENEQHTGYEKQSANCSKRGDQSCGVCVCDLGYYGEKCQCSRDKIASNSYNDQTKCRPDDSKPDADVCSGRGRCECETCRCWKERHFGKYCQCDRGMCQQHISSDVECSGNGRCDCNACVCNPGWEGQYCECRSKHSCMPKGGGNLCSGNGECLCGKCKCEVPHTGKHCEECPTCGEGKCLEFRSCVQCKVWNSGELNETQCNNCSYSKIPTVESLEAQLQQWALLCTFEDESTGCEFNFTYKYTERGYEIYAQNTQRCPEKIDLLAVTFGVICGVVAIGILTLIIWKILTTIHDRREFIRFEKDTKNAVWNTEGNPLYKSPTTTVSNPAFSS